MTIKEYKEIDKFIYNVKYNKYNVDSIILFAFCFKLLKKLLKEREILLDKELLGL